MKFALKTPVKSADFSSNPIRSPEIMSIAGRDHYTVTEFFSVNCLYMSRDLAENNLKEENNSKEHRASDYYF